MRDALLSALSARGERWPGPVEHLDEVGSTNDVLKERARAGAPEFSVVTATIQTAGRGRSGHAWSSPAGNLFLSVLLRPRVPAEDLVALPLAVGVAVAEAASDLGAEALLKWPNDVMSGEKKLGGILVEGSGGAGGVEAVVAGIGVNVGLDLSELPEDLRPRVTSLAVATGRAVPVAEVAAAVLARLRLWYDRLARDGRAPVLAAWKARAVPWWGRTVEARSGGSVLRGTLRDLDARGALLLDLEDGRRVAVVSGEVSELRATGGPPGSGGSLQ
jgi:BirA family biotin operon repressor/biotin-[acetyl-CoA-carboxylase] ligase